MNKKILAVAVSAALMAGASAAMADFKVYGKAHVSIDSMDNGADSPNDESGVYVSSNSSRLGVKGKEDLGNGMSAIMKMEMQTFMADTDNVKSNRNAYLGLQGGFGTVLVGRHDMPFKTAGRKFDLFGDTIGDTRAILRGQELGDDFADRRADVLMYKGKAGAVGFDVAYGVEDGKEDATDMGARVTFKQGPLTVMGAYESHGSGNFGANADDSTGMFLGGKYGMGATTLAAGYASMSSVGGDSDVDASGYTLAVAHAVGGNTFKLQYTAGEADCSGCDKTGSTLLALGVDHKLSKMTKVYAVYASIANEDNAGANFGGTGHDSTVATGAAGDDPSGISIGMIHKF
jgi:predicted porin